MTRLALRLTVVLLLVGVAAFALPLLIGAAVPPGRQVVYMGAVDQQYDLYLLDVDRGLTRRLTNSLANDRFPAWSPDGTLIAFHSDRNNMPEQYSLYVMDQHGRSVRRITPPHPQNVYDEFSFQSGYAMAAWSPDGTQIAFHAGGGDDWDIYVTNLDGTEGRRLTNTRGQNVWPHWSPDGEHILFSSDRGGDMGVYRVNVESGELTRITPERPPIPPQSFSSSQPGSAVSVIGAIPQDTTPAYSPDGTRIAYASNRAGQDRAIFVLDLTTGEERPLTSGAFDDSEPVWTSDGSQIVFTRTDTSTFFDSSIYIMNADGTNARRLIDSALNNVLAPAWRP